MNIQRKNEKSKSKKTLLVLPADLHFKVKSLAYHSGETIVEILNKIIEKHFERHSK